MDSELDDRSMARIVALYEELHRHPELPFAEHHTAGTIAENLTNRHYDVTTGVGGTGVVGVLHNGPGATAMLRADMDGLPVVEQTGLPYASTARGVDPDGRDVAIMHACGHDMHVACLIGASQILAETRRSWSGTLMVLFQPAEELGTGAKAMIEDGLFGRFQRPTVVMGQHVAPFPAGLLAVRPGPAFAAADSIRIVLFGKGGHGSRPEATVDPVVMAAATILRLQTIVSREIPGTDTAVLTIGAVRAGTKENIIPDQAELLLSLRTFDPQIRDRVFEAIHRIIEGESVTAGAPRSPTLEITTSFPAVINDPAATAGVRSRLADLVGEDHVIDPGQITGSEDVGLLATAADAPCVYWLLGGGNPDDFTGITSRDEMMQRMAETPSNHSPFYAPLPRPTLDIGIAALVTATRHWLPAA